MPEGSDNRIVIHCECGAKLKVPAAAAGKKGRCPTCKTVVSIPLPQEEFNDDSGGPIGLSPAPAPSENSLLDELAAQEQDAPQTAQPDGGRKSQTCPACETAIADGAALCMSCGYNLTTGKKTKAATARKTKSATTTRRFALRAGTFPLGCVLSCAGAMVGAIVWSIVCVVTEYEIGYIALGLGLLAGAGMFKGYNTPSFLAGVTAAGIAVVGILAAKATTFVYLSYPEIQEVRRMAAALSDEHAEDRSRLAEHRANLRARHSGFSYSDERNESYYEEEFATILAFEPGKLAIQVEELDAWESGAKWSDPEFVRDYLIYDHIDKEIEAQRDKITSGDVADYWEPNQQGWRQLHAAAVRAVDQISDTERPERAREVQREQERVMESTRLAFHQYHVDSIDDPGANLEDSMKDLNARFRALSDDERDAAIQELEAWNNGGKWNDAEYIRNAAIRDHVDETIQQRNEAIEDENADWWEPSDAERKTMREEAALVVDATPHDQRVVERKQEEANLAALTKNFRQQQARAFSEEVAGEAFGFFVENYFDMIDILFAVFAIGSAFRIARGGDDE